MTKDDTLVGQDDKSHVSDERNESDDGKEHDQPDNQHDPNVVTCGLCLEDKTRHELDVECSVCKFRICYECMFEYIKFNKNRYTLLCPHCRQDLLDDIDLDDSDKECLLSMFLVQSEIEQIIEALDNFSEDDTSDSDYEDDTDDTDDTTDSDDSDTSQGTSRRNSV